ncbi:MAG TPA: acyl-CoA dehydrogenase family protein [Acidimicrobiales bacterium]|jgi:acyl-CoA dehydrogenase|nr:acyl-CoA dehydrogenase family protein [Acidimicrobiales bacterium]
MADVSLEDFSEEVTAFLDTNAKRKDADDKPFVWGEGEDDIGLFEEIDRDVEKRALTEAQEWRAKRYDAGLGWITGPKEYGGRELTAAHDRAYAGIEAKYDIPSQSFFGIGLGMVAPTILAHAQPHIRDRYLAKMYRGDIVGCQLFSEPGAGSDLASLQTRAERDGEEWLLNGQKVWTSGAQYSDIGEIICRTDPDKPKHKGLTGFVVDMHAPGVEVRPLRQMTGGASFNEVFFTDVRVPDDHRLGDENEGWAVALTTLMNERASIGAGSAGGGLGLANSTRLIEMLRHFGLDTDPVYRQELMKLHVAYSVAKYNNQRATDKIKSGQLPGPEMSIAKLALTQNMWNTAQFVSRVLGPRIAANTGEWGTFSWSQFVLGIPGMRIAGGSDEVMRNIVAERVLGLPKDPGIDSKTPFKDLKVGTQQSS